VGFWNGSRFKGETVLVRASSRDGERTAIANVRRARAARLTLDWPRRAISAAFRSEPQHEAPCAARPRRGDQKSVRRPQQEINRSLSCHFSDEKGPSLCKRTVTKLNAVGARADYLNVLSALYLKGHFKKIAISRSQLYMNLKTTVLNHPVHKTSDLATKTSTDGVDEREIRASMTSEHIQLACKLTCDAIDGDGIRLSEHEPAAERRAVRLREHLHSSQRVSPRAPRDATRPWMHPDRSDAMNHRDVKSTMLQPGETVFEAAHRIGAIREQRAAWRGPVDKLAERDRLTRIGRPAIPCGSQSFAGSIRTLLLCMLTPSARECCSGASACFPDTFHRTPRTCRDERTGCGARGSEASRQAADGSLD
jgi:hypothetical protein